MTQTPAMDGITSDLAAPCPSQPTPTAPWQQPSPPRCGSRLPGPRMMGPTTSSLQPLICKASKELEARNTGCSTWTQGVKMCEIPFSTLLQRNFHPKNFWISASYFRFLTLVVEFLKNFWIISTSYFRGSTWASKRIQSQVGDLSNKSMEVEIHMHCVDPGPCR